MLHTSAIGMLEPLHDSTFAAYFFHGVQAGILKEDDAKSWAFAIIEARERPDINIIEVATANDRACILQNLFAIAGGGDNIQLAGRWLFSDLQRELNAKSTSIRDVLRKAMRVAKSTNMPEEVYYEFDQLEDCLLLAESNTYGSISDVLEGAQASLAAHALPSVSAT